jgi:hypothetical protein
LSTSFWNGFLFGRDLEMTEQYKMDIDDAINLFERAGLKAKRIKTMTLELEGFHVGENVRHIEGEGDYIVGNLVTILHHEDNGGIWTAQITSDEILKSSESLEEVIDAVCDYYDINHYLT